MWHTPPNFKTFEGKNYCFSSRNTNIIGATLVRRVLSDTVTRGAFHLAKISGSNGWNANGTRGSRGNFPEQTDNLRSCSTFFVATDRNGNMPFHLHDGEIFPAISNVLWAGAHWLTCKINVVVKMAERREGEKTVGWQQDAQKDDDEGTFRHFKYYS